MRLSTTTTPYFNFKSCLLALYIYKFNVSHQSRSSSLLLKGSGNVTGLKFRSYTHTQSCTHHHQHHHHHHHHYILHLYMMCKVKAKCLWGCVEHVVKSDGQHCYSKSQMCKKEYTGKIRNKLKIAEQGLDYGKIMSTALAVPGGLDQATYIHVHFSSGNNIQCS